MAKRPWYKPEPTYKAEPPIEAAVVPEPSPVEPPAPVKAKAKAPKAAKPKRPRQVAAKSPPAPAAVPLDVEPPAESLEPEKATEKTRGRKRRVAIVDGPDPIDVFVGTRIRQRRVMLGVSQQSLARSLGLTFQQVQKQERGKNRVSCSALWRIAEALDVPVSFFFDGVKDLAASSADPLDFDGEDDAGPTLAELRLLGKLRQIPEGPRETIVKLIDATAKIEG